jgi:hypothetical protein
MWGERLDPRPSKRLRPVKRLVILNRCMDPRRSGRREIDRTGSIFCGSGESAAGWRLVVVLEVLGQVSV